MEEKGNGHKPMEIEELAALVGEGSIDKALKSKDDTNNSVRYIMTTDGAEIEDNALRYDIKDYRSVVAFASLYNKCKRHGHADGQNELKLILGLIPAIKGKRVSIFSDTVIGERKNFNGASTALDKMKKFAGLG